MDAIDLNADVGEGAPQDHALLACVTSANIACGAHAGDAQTMAAAVRAAVEHHVAIGAHPGHEDRDNFGRREIPISPEGLIELLTKQIAMLAEAADQQGARVRYVKLHGALYHQAGRDDALADAVVRVAADYPGGLAILGQPRSRLAARAAAAGVEFFCEAFADRAYLSTGALASRKSPGAVHDDIDSAVRQAVRIVVEGSVDCLDGGSLPVLSHSLCVHGDKPRAAEVAAAVKRALAASGVGIRPFAS